MNNDMLKALLIHAAYQGAIAVCEPLITNPDGTTVKLDPLIQDVGLQQKALLVYEEAKIQYAAIMKAFKDKTGIWPDPPASASFSSGLTATPAPQTATAVVAAVQSLFKPLPQTVASDAATQLVGLLGAVAKSIVTTPPTTAPATPATPAQPTTIPAP